ncbi:hypothetical protein QE152_g7694 [Popillia japonica]|uniref:Nuclease HARBI1 n=1 Tax=Popillia japonica TaxID=7064 RepID=A0AAW1M8X8_POPJA
MVASTSVDGRLDISRHSPPFDTQETSGRVEKFLRALKYCETEETISIGIWQNGITFWRSIRLQFLHEDVQSTRKEVTDIEQQIGGLAPYATVQNGKSISVTYCMSFTMIDGTTVLRPWTSLRFYASAGHLASVADFMGMHVSTASRIIRRLSQVLGNLSQQHIPMPAGNDLAKEEKMQWCFTTEKRIFL